MDGRVETDVITPTIGRVVHFRPGPGARAVMCVRSEQPLCAHIINVWNERRVALHVIDHEGHTHFIASAQLLQDGDMPPTNISYCEWVQYQRDVAAHA